MNVFTTFRLGILALLLFSCTKAEKSSQEIPSESFPKEVAATEVRTAAAERRSFDYLINAIGKLEEQSEISLSME